MLRPWTFPLGWPTELSIDHAIAALAEQQFGVVAIWQLTALGLSSSGVRHRVAAGRLHRVERGVYAVGHGRMTRAGRWAAAALASGPDSILAEITAAHNLELTTWSSKDVHVLSAGRRCRRRPGIIAHTCGHLPADEWTIHDGLPCTSWARTVLAASRPRRVVEQVLDRAETLRVFDLRELARILGRTPGRPGSGVVRSILGSYEIGQDLPRNDCEELMRSICVDYGIPLPRINVPMQLGDRWIEADFFWPEARLVVEVDGFATHGTRKGFKSDRTRDRNLTLNSDLALLRFAADEIHYEQRTVAADIIQMLASGRKFAA